MCVCLVIYVIVHVRQVTETCIPPDESCEPWIENKSVLLFAYDIIIGV